MPDDRDDLIERVLRESPRALGFGAGPCLDAETAAAWADGRLDDGALEDARRHAADCSRCQTLMATLLSLEPTAGLDVEPQTVAARRSSRRWFMWTIPLATAAMAVIALVVWTRSTPEGPPQASQIAERRAEPAPTDLQSAATVPSASVEQPASVPPARRPAAAAKTRQVAPGQGQSVMRDAEKRSAQPAERAAAAPAAPLAASVPRAASDSLAETVTVQREAATASPAAKLNRPVEPAVTVVSTDPAIRWQYLGGRVLKSSDGGSTWTSVNLAVPRPIRAGASPSLTTCWLVGVDGLVVVTVDGTNWTRAAFPESVDLIAVTAVDARSTTVTAADGRRFDTHDGGATWTEAGAGGVPR